jgi:glycolate oxidase
VVGDQHVRADAGARHVYSQDATPLFRGEPDVVVLPASTEEVAGIVSIAGELGVPVIPRGAGTNLSAGTIAHRGGIVLTLTRMSQLLELDLENLVAVCQPGLTTAKLEAAKVDIVVAVNPGCLRQLQTGLRRRRSKVRAVHLAELLVDSQVVGERLA